MTTAKRAKMHDEDDVAFVDEIESKIRMKREWGERFEREEEDCHGWLEPTAFEEVQGVRCRQSVKASEEKTELEEEVTLVLAGMKETNAESRDEGPVTTIDPYPNAMKNFGLLINNGTILLRVRHHYYGGGGEEEKGIEEKIAVPAASNPAKPRNRSSRKKKKRKAAAQVEDQPRKVKKVKTGEIKKKPRWTPEENAALLEGVNEYGLDFDRIKAEAGTRLVRRKARALYDRFVERHPDRFRELREVNGKKSSANTGTAWTAEEDEALKRGVSMHGADWKTIMETETEVLKGRTAGAAQARYNRHYGNYQN
ncbi:hypothetical protein TrLO_g8344 [Triparma laevis f. longispina]|uniref:Myb-like domain-containing protein n=1 Tax=Triparma laevis f. longispina TaxID=1714387 RepID=A0A9W7FE29_9STRA|nr:hypothetical protein TrLO_g8344 [Triparma laevis f. longispina]